LGKATEVAAVWDQLAENMYLKDSPTAVVRLSELATFSFGKFQSNIGLPEVARPVVGERGYIVALQLKILLMPNRQKLTKSSCRTKSPKVAFQIKHAIKLVCVRRIAQPRAPDLHVNPDIAAHCEETGRSTARFIRIGRGLSRLKNSDR
jgi:hypothetical protein